jgi:chromosome segregation ATPase
MSMRQLTLVLPVALAFGLVACDSRDYEGEISELQGQLDEAQAELEAQRAENQTLTGEVEELRTQAEQPADTAAATGGEANDAVRAQLETARERASQTAERLAAIEAEPDAPAADRTAAIAILRTGAEEIVVAIDAAADQLGIELQRAAGTEGAGEGQAQPGVAQESQAQQPEPAAGPEGEQQPQAD